PCLPRECPCGRVPLRALSVGPSGTSWISWLRSLPWNSTTPATSLAPACRCGPPRLFEIGGRRLYTWCALDTLILPAMLGRAARVTSPCAATGASVRLLVSAEGIDELEPASAVLSLHLFEGRDVRNAFCRDVNFFVSQNSTAGWLHTHPGAWVLPVAQAHSLARDLARQLADGGGPTCC